MPHVNCRICKKRIPSNKRQHLITSPCYEEKLQEYEDKYSVSLSRDGFMCPTCHFTIWTNKKVSFKKICIKYLTNLQTVILTCFFHSLQGIWHPILCEEPKPVTMWERDPVFATVRIHKLNTIRKLIWVASAHTRLLNQAWLFQRSVSSLHLRLLMLKTPTTQIWKPIVNQVNVLAPKNSFFYCWFNLQ